MLARYGDHGFNWRLGDVIGLQIVEVPAAPARNKALRSVMVTIGALSCVLIIISSVFLILLRRYVVRPLQHVTSEAASLSLGQPPPARHGVAMDGQFHDLERALARLKASLEESMRALRGGSGKPEE